MKTTRSKLSHEQLNALRKIADGADVYDYGIAQTLRGIERTHPHLLTITKPQHRPSGEKQQPYFGAICTDDGLRLVTAIKASKS